MNCRFPEEVEVVRLPVVPLYVSWRVRLDTVFKYKASTSNVNGEYEVAPERKVPFRFVPVIDSVTCVFPSLLFLSLIEAWLTSKEGVNPEYVNDRKASTEKVDDGIVRGFAVNRITMLSAIVV